MADVELTDDRFLTPFDRLRDPVCDQVEPARWVAGGGHRVHGVSRAGSWVCHTASSRASAVARPPRKQIQRRLATRSPAPARLALLQRQMTGKGPAAKRPFHDRKGL